MIPEILWLILMVGAIIATIVAAIREKKSRAAVAAMMQPAPMSMGGESESMDSFGDDGQSGFEFNVDSFK